MKQLIRIAVACLLMLTAANQAEAGPVLWASTGGANSTGGGRIYTIDPVTQVVTLIGDTGLSRASGLDFDGSGVLHLAVGGSVGPAELYTVNTTNASAALVGTIAPIQGVDGLAFDGSGTLYGAGWGGGNGHLLTIDPTTGAVLTDIVMSGSGNSFVAGLSFDSSGQLFGSRGNAGGRTEDLVQINTANGVHTAIGTLTNVISDIWFAADGTLYGASPTGELFTIDPVTGAKTLLFNTGIRLSGLTGLDEVNEIPEPASIALLATGFIGIAGLRRRRK